MDRRQFVIGSAASAATAWAHQAAAQDGYPSRPITILNAFPPGGINDLVTRPAASALESIFKQPVVVETKAGAAGAVGAQVAANAKPDGYTLLSHNNGIGDDFAMIQIYPQYQSWVNPTMPVWGGPQGVYRSNAPTVVEHFGHGVALGTGGTPRAGLAPIMTARGGTAFAWYGAGPGAPST